MLVLDDDVVDSDAQRCPQCLHLLIQKPIHLSCLKTRRYHSSSKYPRSTILWKRSASILRPSTSQCSTNDIRWGKLLSTTTQPTLPKCNISKKSKIERITTKDKIRIWRNHNIDKHSNLNNHWTMRSWQFKWLEGAKYEIPSFLNSHPACQAWPKRPTLETIDWHTGKITNNGRKQFKSC